MNRKIVTIVGARPQFIKAACVSRAIAKSDQIEEVLVHTGQHYDYNMSQVFFNQLGLAEPKYNLEVGSGAHGKQTGLMMERIEATLLQEKPDMVMVYGDTNSTLAGALAAKKLNISLIHVEAGVRSFNRRMPEEINRVVVDNISDILFCPSDLAVFNLSKEGVKSGVHDVGDVMYDSIRYNIKKAKQQSDVLDRMGLQSYSYYMATIHRPENTDDRVKLQNIFDALGKLDKTVIIPMHPRTLDVVEEYGIETNMDNTIFDEPLDYYDTLVLLLNAKMVFTDSGGMQKEAYYLKTNCVTLRDETEWRGTVALGRNILVGADSEKIISACEKFKSEITSDYSATPYGTGNASEKIIDILVN